MNRLYSVYDKVAEEYGAPFIAKNDAIASRLYQVPFKREQELRRTDFRLCYVGKFDAERGVLIPDDPYEVVPRFDDDE